ncbi:MAG: carbon-nitrogen hydrolase family protein [Pseudoxanthomonas sp.]
MRATVCELPNEIEPLVAAWKALCEHTVRERSELLVLPEFAFARPVWEIEDFDHSVWRDAESQSDWWIARLGELGVKHVIGARPVTAGDGCFNEGFLWSAESGYQGLRRKHFLPDEPGGRETRWFARGDAAFPPYSADSLTFGLNICTELWALHTYAAYAIQGVQAVICPRATCAATAGKWLSVATVAAVRSGAYCLSSNRAQPDGSYGGASWIISPDGELLARTSDQQPFRTLDIDLAASDLARKTYPRYVFATHANQTLQTIPTGHLALRE